MTERACADFIESCKDAVKDSAIPVPFREWSAVSAIAGALGKRVWYDFGAFKLRPNMYVCLVAGPGRNKSVSLNLPFGQVMSALSTAPGSKKGSDDWNTKLNDYDREVYPLHVISDRITAERLALDMARCGRIDTRLTRVTGDAFHDNSLTLVTSEFGSFMHRNDANLQMFLTDVWDSRDDGYSYKTKNAGESIIRGPCLNWIACVTPTQFVENLPENARSQGLLSRIIPVLYDGERVARDIWYGKASVSLIENLRNTLSHISDLQGEFTLADDAREIIRKDIQEGLQPRPIDPNMSEYCERRDSHIFKLAMCVSASHSDDLVITLDDWERAKRMLFEAEAKMPEVLEHFGLSKAGRIALDLEEYANEMFANIDSKNPKIALPIFKREIMRRVSTASEVSQTLTEMQEAGMIRIAGKWVIKPPEKVSEPTKES